MLRGPILSPSLTSFIRGCEGRRASRVSSSSKSNLCFAWLTLLPFSLCGDGLAGHGGQHFCASVHLCHLVKPSNPTAPPTELPGARGMKLGWAHTAQTDIHHQGLSKDKDHTGSPERKNTAVQTRSSGHVKSGHRYVWLWARKEQFHRQGRPKSQIGKTARLALAPFITKQRFQIWYKKGPDSPRCACRAPNPQSCSLGT